MTSAPATTSRELPLVDKTVVVMGGSAGIGLETARLARANGAEVILAARNSDRLERAAQEVNASSTSAFDVTDWTALAAFFDGLPGPVDHVLVTAGGSHYGPLSEIDLDEAQSDVNEHIFLTLRVARHAMATVRPTGSLLFMGGTGGRRPGRGLTIAATLTAGLPALIRNLAIELAPVRGNLVAAGFVDTPLSAAILGDQLENRRAQLRETLPIRRVVGPADVAALAVHLMTNTALTGATYDVDGGQQLV
jgi:NAD(P)-dependent dehydrogenase (short-subunit alcohol dehydrogenase family)